MKQNKILVDTNFLIKLYDKSQEHHHTCREWFEQFKNQKQNIYLSTIVVFEFYQQSQLSERVLDNFKILTFNLGDAKSGAKIAMQLKNDKNKSRVELKNDIKLLGQAINNKMTHIITGDNDFGKYLNRLSPSPEIKIIDIKEPYSDQSGRMKLF